MVILGTKNVSMQLKMSAGFGEDGSAKYQTKSISGINPALSDDDFYAAAEAVVSLMDNSCHAVHRIVSDELLK